MITIKNLGAFAALILFLLTFSSTSLFSQETNKEVGVYFYGLDQFDFIYKKETQPNKFLRLRSIGISGNFTSVEDQEQLKFGLGAAIGWEKRKSITEDLHFIHGWEPSLYVSAGTSGDSFENRYLNATLGIGYIFGLNCSVSKKLTVSLETIPQVAVTSTTNSYEIGEERTTDTTNGISAGFDTNFLRLGVSYKFVK